MKNVTVDYVEPISSSAISSYECANSFLPNQEEEKTCEVTSLWRAVITQALMDAGTNSGKLENKKEKMNAISWLMGDSDDFYEVCHMASLEPSYVKQKAKEAINRGCKWRAEKNPFQKKIVKIRKTEKSDSFSEGKILKVNFGG